VVLLAKERPFQEELALEIAKSQFGVPTLGILTVLTIPAMAGIILALLGWDDEKLPAGNKLTDWQKFLILATFPNPLIPKLFLNETQAKQLDQEMTEAARLAPFGAGGIKLFFEPLSFILRMAKK